VASQHRKHRGYETQRIAADWFKQRGWPYVTPAGAGQQGVDLLNMPHLAPEVKGRRQLDLPGFLRQATTNAGGSLPFLVVRPDGYGPARVGEWAMILTLRDGTALLTEAGYGSGYDANL
jgi:hypothetical protein